MTDGTHSNENKGDIHFTEAAIDLFMRIKNIARLNGSRDARQMILLIDDFFATKGMFEHVETNMREFYINRNTNNHGA